MCHAGRAHAGRLAFSIAVALLVVTSSGALAQSGDDKAAAEVAFQDGRRLMTEGRYAEACPKFLASQRLDPGVGTLLNLGDCYEKNGQTASAWAQFIEAASEAHRLGDARREAAARGRAAALEGDLTRLTIAVSAAAAATAGLQIKRDGTLVDRALWGSPTPVDPGDCFLEATAPGRKKWGATVRIPVGGAPVTVEVPALESDPVAIAPMPSPTQPGMASGVDASLRATSDEPRSEKDESLLSKWWVWAAAGGVVTGVVIVAVIAAGGTETHTRDRVEGTDGMVVATLTLGEP